MDQRKNRRAVLKGGLAIVAGSLTSQACGAKPPLVPTEEFPDGGPQDGSDSGLADAGEPDAGQPDAGGPLPRPTTTARWRIQGVLPSEAQPDFLKKLWGVTRQVSGDAHLRTDLLDVDVTAGNASGEAVSLLYFTQLTDVHIIDEESPARTINLDKLATAAWRSQESYSTQVLDAMVRKVRALDAVRPIDFVLFTGDVIENNQKNELAWFLKVIEGGTLQPNSGALEDPEAGPDNDPHDAFVALGLGAIPWYAVLGNHDLLIQGNLGQGPVVDYSLVTGDPTRGTVNALDLGRVNPPQCNPIPVDEAPTPGRCIPTIPTSLSAGTLPADAARANLNKSQYFAALAAAPGGPAGHGFGTTLASSGDGDFVVEPVVGLPLRLVVLNTVAATGAQGNMPQGKIDGFLDTALKQAETDQVLVIVSSHHPSDGIPFTGQKLRDRLAACPNVVLHIAGHTHDNVVTARPGPSAHRGYWEVQTASLAEWPQQSRLVELVDRRDGTAELWLTLLDYDTGHQPLGPLAEGSRFLALREVHSGARGSGTTSEGRVIDRNVILPVALTPELRTRLAAVAGKPIESKLLA